jgi:hypothetical protein
VSEPALSLAFFDPAHRLSGTARAGATLLYEGKAVRTLPEPPDLARDGTAFSARLAGRLDLEFEVVSDEVHLPGSRNWVCAVTGTAEGRRVDCLGTATETTEPPAWAQLDMLRAISAVFDSENAIFFSARRPSGVPGHGHELTSAALIAAGEVLSVDDARLSTVYDAEGRQRTAGLELWLPGEDYPRRAHGTAQAGASILLGGVRVNAAVFDWQMMDGRAGAGAYELALREEEDDAA